MPVCQRSCILGRDKIGSPDRAEEQAPARKHCLLVAVGHHVRQMRVRMPGRRDDRDCERSDGDLIAVGDTAALVVDGVIRVHE